ncbi:MAG TPA: alpha-ketoglutarate-dependent dioxygenase AlkB [Pyrinomonadaceae bacterium]|nr:alpha-ketoglutarate-dependent dioxygenase AlkB [Pyrinomonadaceae bacterium]
MHKRWFKVSCQNFYAPKTGKLGLHVDDTEEDRESPIVTFSLGESCQFAIGGANKTDPVQRIIINSGDCLIMHRQGRNIYHGVEKLYPHSSQLLKNGGRISLTFRRNKPLKITTF